MKTQSQTLKRPVNLSRTDISVLDEPAIAPESGTKSIMQLHREDSQVRSRRGQLAARWGEVDGKRVCQWL